MHSRGADNVPPTPERGAARPRRRFIARFAVVLVLLVVLVPAALFGVLQTSRAKATLTRWVVARLEAGGLNVSMAPIEGLLPWRVRIPHVEVKDKKGTCFLADEVAISWDPCEALRGRLHVYEAQAQSIYAAHFPAPRESRRAPSPASVFRILSKMRVDHARVSKATVANDRMPANAAFEIEGKLASAAGAGAIRSSLQVRPLAGPATSASVEISIKTDLSVMSVQANYNEAPGGLLAATLHLPADHPVEIALTGEGPLSDWRGAIKARGGEDAELDAPVQIRWNGAFEMLMDGTVRFPGALISANLHPWLDDENRFTIAVSTNSFDKLAWPELNIVSSRAALQTHGAVDMKTGRLSAEYALTVNDAALVEQTFGFSAAVPFELKGTFDGSLRSPKIIADIEAKSFIYREFKTDAVKCHLNATCDDARRIELAEATIKTDEQRLSASGEIEIPERKGTLDFDLAAKEFVGWVKGSGTHQNKSDLDCSISAKGRATFDLTARAATATVQGTLADLHGVPPNLESLADDPVQFSATVSTTDGKQVHLENLKVATPHLATEGEAAYLFENKEIEASCAISLTEAGFLSQLAKRPVRGSLRVEGKASGVWPALKTEVDVDAKNAAVGDFRADRFSISAQADSFPKDLKGRVNASIAKAGQEGTLAGNVALHKKSLELSALKIEIPGGSIKGKLAADLEKKRCKGDLHAALNDVAWLSRVVGRELAGRAIADVRLDADKAGQRLTGDLKATGLKSGASSVESATAKFDLKNLLDAPYGALHVELARGTLGRLALRTAYADYNGDPRRGTADLRADGEYGQPLDVSLNANITRSVGATSFQVTGLVGHAYNRSLTLAQPFAVTLDDVGLDVGKAVLSLAPSGRIEAALRMNRSDMHAAMALSGLALDKMPQGGKPVVSGTLSGEIALNGDPAGPAASVQLGIRELRPAAPAMAQFVPASLAIDGVIEAGVLRGHVSEKGELLGNPIEGRFSVPVQMSVLPPAFKIPDDGALEGNLAIHAELARVASLLLLDDQRMSGTAGLELTIGGTAAQPVFKGDGAVQNGAYEHFVSGTVLKDLQARLSGDGSRLRLEEATATDGGGGHIRANGSMQLSLAKGFPLDVSADIKGCTLIRRDDVTATFDAAMKLVGTLVAPKITGDVHAQTIEVNIPDRAPPPIVALDVRDQGAPPAKAASDAPPKFRRGWLRAHFGLDFDLDAPGRTFVRGQGIDSEWKGKFHFAGTALDPSITGDATLVRGRYSILGKRFAFTKGTAQFRGEWPPAPAIDVESETQLKDMKGYLKVTGTTAAPALTIESDPPAARDEILARMLFNRDLARISPFEALQLAEAANMLAGAKGLFQFTERARKILRVDNIDVTQEKDNLKDSSVRVGKYLRDDVYVQVEQGLNSDTGKLQTEVNITPDLSLESTVDRNAKTGIGLKWKKDY